jgi:hypothetical protein
MVKIVHFGQEYQLKNEDVFEQLDYDESQQQMRNT